MPTPKTQMITAKSRREFLAKFGTVSALGLFPATTPLPATITPLRIEAGPYLQNVHADAATIMWITNQPCFSWVEYGDGNHLHQKLFDYKNGLIQANNRINKIKLKGIKPGTTHKYRIVSTPVLEVKGSQFHFGEPFVSTIYTFATPKEQEDSFKMVVFNDHHERPQTIPELLYRFAYKGNEKDFDLVVFNGDVFDNAESEKQLIEQFLRPCVDIFAKEIPFLFVQGNHEVRGAFARNIPDYFSFVDEKFYHAYTRGPMRIIVLDGGEDKTDDNWEYKGLAAFDPYREEQREWLAAEINSEAYKNAPFRVVLIHIPPWHSGDWHGPKHCREMFGDLLNQGKVDLLLSGHTHRYGTYPPDSSHNFPIMIGGGPIAGNRTLIMVEANGQTLNAKMIRDDGKVLSDLAIPKPKRG